MKNKTLLTASLFVFLLFTPDIVHSQNTDYTHFTTKDGLPSPTMYEVFQDSKDFVWLATAAGVSRFDGYTFTNYTTEDGLADNEIFGFYEDVFNRIWFRSLNGNISYFFRGKIYNSKNDPSLRKLDKPSVIRKITGASDNSVLITHNTHGFSKYTPEKEVFEFSFNKDSTIDYYVIADEDADGNFKVVGSNFMITSDADNQIIKRNKLPGFLRSQLIASQYYGCSHNKFYKIDPEKEPVLLHTTKSIINNICDGKNDIIWLCTNKGAVRWNKISQQSITFLENEEVSSVLQDNEGNLWFTTLNNGFFIATNQPITNYTSENGLVSDKVICIEKDNEKNLWLGHDTPTLTKITATGHISLRKILEPIPEFYKPLSNLHINKIIAENSELLIIGSLSLFYVDNNDITFAVSLHGKSTSKWYGDTYLVAGSHGLRTFSKSQLKKHKLDKMTPNPPVHTSLTEAGKFDSKQIFTQRALSLHRQDEGEMWIGLDKGLIFLTRDTLINFHELNPVFQERIVDIKADSSGTLFLATNSNGILIMKKNGEVSRISKKEGLSSNQCNTIEIENSRIWIGTNAGINSVTLTKNYLPEKIYIINASHGLLSDYINDIFIDNEKIWIGTSGGLSVVDKDIKNENERAPVTYVTNVSVNNQHIDTLSKKEFNYQENNFKIEYVGLSYKSKSKLNYKYKLIRMNEFSTEGTDNWQETKNTSVDISLLPPGTYTFSVMAQSASGSWSSPVVYNFLINVPFWKTKWFVILVTFTSTILALSLWKYAQKIRERKSADRRKLQLAELKSLRSRMNYHFMSNAFNSLQGLFFSDKGVDQYVGKFSKLMRFTLEYADRQQIPLSEEIAYVQLYCDIEQLRVGDRFALKIEFDVNLKSDSLIVPALTLQPLIENAIWHGIMPMEVIGMININVLSNDADSYKIIIEDNGAGINASLKNKRKTNRKSYGTKLIMERFEVIRQQSKNKFSIAIEDLADINQTSGTRVTLILPYKYDD